MTFRVYPGEDGASSFETLTANTNIKSQFLIGSKKIVSVGIALNFGNGDSEHFFEFLFRSAFLPKCNFVHEKYNPVMPCGSFCIVNEIY